MAYRSAPIAENVIWRAPFTEKRVTLADAIRTTIATNRAHMLDFIRLDALPPTHAMPLAIWSRPAELRRLLAIYGDHIYRNKPTQAREDKPLLSLWAQWYLGLLVPPLMLALLTGDSVPDLSPEHFHVEFHETGRAACFWIEVIEDMQGASLSATGRMEKLITHALMPVVQALEATGEINGKLIWSNTGYLINWYLGEMKSLLGDTLTETLRQHCFFHKQLEDGSDNPLWRTVVPRDGLLVRRTCCQRYRLPDVQQCGDCTLIK
ncbi:hydroxamate siderophore iron reductase FhuF [Superficieibacter electus]|uniref:Hydroxamate siderophore iron reductase FhuF n=1 Tax=Superficieibacter electus TaxID=2022662 RepID=A0A2P5GQI8_9ENTR|nr:siderophore-iron reductase FhuF [Superficieibacter electus]POP45681.1 hydroxamate siderophore iron reductase FhuF [Superficieibacter electus]POP48842.1 hydroxamate siderophore iron reductase FhuF [Superficieibacter electus]